MVSKREFIRIALENLNLNINEICHICRTSYNKFKLLFPGGMKEFLENIILHLKNSEKRDLELITLSDIAHYRLHNLKQFTLQIFENGGIKIPVIASGELAEIVGLTIGDGNIWLDKRYEAPVPRHVRFYNRDEKLLNYYREITSKIFGVNTEIKHRIIDHSKTRSLSNKLQYSSYLEYINTAHAIVLCMLGVPAGAKPFISFRVPSWIREGTKEVKKGFIRGVWTADGSIPYPTNLRAMTFQMDYSHWKHKERINDGIIFLEDIKDILSKFGISSCTIIHDKKCYKKGTDKETHSLRLLINTNKDIIEFYKNIGLMDSLKMETFSKRMVLID